MPIVPVGSTNLAAQQVPNIYVSIVPPNPLLNGVPTNIIGVVGTAIWGPKNSPTVMGSIQEYIAQFGNPQATMFDMGTQVYNALQQGGNNFRCVRVTDGTDNFASVDILDNTTATGAIFYSKYTGVLPNPIESGGIGCNVIIGVGSNSTMSAPTYKCTIYFNGGTPEVFDNIGGTGAAFWSNLVNAVNLGQSNVRGPSQICTAVTDGDVSSVTLVQGGTYVTLPTVSTMGPGSGATFAVHMAAQSGVVAAIGTGYNPTETIALTGGTHSVSTVMQITNVRLATVAVNAAGAAYQVGDTITVAGGTFSQAAILTVATVDGSGAVETVTITNPGVYTVNPSTFTQGSTSGVGSGATFETTTWGVNAVTVNTAGNYTALPTNPVAQGSTLGSGTGATITMAWTVLSVAVTAGGSGYTTSSTISFSGSGGGIATLALGSANPPAQNVYVLSGGSNGNAGVNNATLIGNDFSSPRTGMYALRKTGCSIVVLADQTDPTEWNAQQVYGLSEGSYMIVPMVAGYQDDINGALTVRFSVSVSSYAVKIMMGDWIYMLDPFNNVTRLVSPQGYVAGVLAVQSPSGSSLNKIMNNIVGTQKSSENRVYSDADLAALQNGGIDVITNYIPASPTSAIFGVRLGVNASGTATTNGDNYTRMINFLAETFNVGLGLFVGLPQTPDVQSQARATLNTFLQNLVSLRLIGTTNGSPAYRVTLDSTNNPPNRVALGFMQADVQVTLYSIVLSFIVNLQAGQSVQIQVLPTQLAA